VDILVYKAAGLANLDKTQDALVNLDKALNMD
jgi:hypothetical protein